MKGSNPLAHGVLRCSEVLYFKASGLLSFFGDFFVLPFFFVLRKKSSREFPERVFKAWSLRVQKMYVEGFKAKLEKDTSYKGLWTVSFTLKEF